MRPTTWELAILTGLVADESDSCFIVTVDAGHRIRLWHILQMEFPLQDRFVDYADFSEFVFCDCPAQGKGFVVPSRATKIFVHLREVTWGFVTKPTCEIIEEPRYAVQDRG